MMTGCELSLSSVVPISVYSAQPSSERHLRPLRFVSHHFEHKNPEEVQPWEIFCYVGGLQKTNLRTIESGSSKYIGPKYNRGITTCVIEFSFLLRSIFISVPLDLAVAFGVFIAMKTIGLHHGHFCYPKWLRYWHMFSCCCCFFCSFRYFQITIYWKPVLQGFLATGTEPVCSFTRLFPSVTDYATL